MLKMFGFYDRKSIPAGKVFVKEGEPGYEAYLIQAGSVRIFTEQEGQKITLAEVGPGDIIGEIALILDEPRSASMETLEATTVVVITRDTFNKLMAKTDQTIQSVLKLLTNRITKHNNTTIDAYHENANIDPDSMLITQSFARSMTAERKAQFVAEVGPHMSNLIKSLKRFKTSA